MTAETEITTQLLEQLVSPFFEQGEKQVYVAIGCDRIYVAPKPSEKCLRCNGVHQNHLVTSVQAVRGIPLTIP